MRILDPKTKKRKLTDPASNKFPQPLKKAAVGTTSSTKPTAVVKKEPGSMSITTKAPPQAVKDAKADSSFFSAPKPKAKLPSFKKAPVPVQVKKEESNNIAVPSSYDPFQEVLKSMKARKESPAVSTPPATSTPNSMLDSQQGLARNLRKKKSVTWAPDHQLESIKLIEKAIYDDDPVDVSIFSSFRVLYIDCHFLIPLCFLPALFFILRVHIWDTACAIWIEERVRLYTPSSSKKSWIGQNHCVSKSSRTFRDIFITKHDPISSFHSSYRPVSRFRRPTDRSGFAQ